MLTLRVSIISGGLAGGIANGRCYEGQIVSRDRRFRCAILASQERGIGRRTLAAA